MLNITKYNIFILLSTFSRNIVEFFSIIIIYKKGFDIKDIIVFYIVYYLIAIIASTISLLLSNKYNSKFILIFSSIMYAISYLYFLNLSNNMISLIVFSILLSISNYTYHPIRHLYALNLMDKNKVKRIRNILICNYLAIIISSYLGPFITLHLGLHIVIMILIIISIISILFLFNIKSHKEKEVIKITFHNIDKNKLLFFIFEQFKVIFLLLQPIYIYLYISKNLEYIGIINIIVSISSILSIYLFSKVSFKTFRIMNTLLCIVLLIKLNINNPTNLIPIVILEGIGIKVFEVFSTKNIYNIDKKQIVSYLILIEIIFCFTSAIIFILFWLLDNIKLMLYISIIFIFLCGITNLKIDNHK